MSALSDSLVVHAVFDRERYAAAASVIASVADESVTCVAPLTVPGGKPVTELPGLRPRFPVMTVLPVLVTVVEPNTAKLLDAPRLAELSGIVSDIIFDGTEIVSADVETVPPNAKILPIMLTPCPI